MRLVFNAQGALPSLRLLNPLFDIELNVCQKRKALITGITGQDGSYLTELLLEKGYEAWHQAAFEQLQHQSD